MSRPSPCSPPPPRRAPRPSPRLISAPCCFQTVSAATHTARTSSSVAAETAIPTPDAHGRSPTPRNMRLARSRSEARLKACAGCVGGGGMLGSWAFSQIRDGPGSCAPRTQRGYLREAAQTVWLLGQSRRDCCPAAPPFHRECVESGCAAAGAPCTVATDDAPRRLSPSEGGAGELQAERRAPLPLMVRAAATGWGRSQMERARHLGRDRTAF